MLSLWEGSIAFKLFLDCWFQVNFLREDAVASLDSTEWATLGGLAPCVAGNRINSKGGTLSNSMEVGLNYRETTFTQKLVKTLHPCWRLSLKDHGSQGSAKVLQSFGDCFCGYMWHSHHIASPFLARKTMGIPPHISITRYLLPCDFCVRIIGILIHCHILPPHLGVPTFFSPRHREGLFDCQDRYLSGQELGEEELLWSRCGQVKPCFHGH